MRGTEPLLGPKRQKELLKYIRTYGAGSVNELARLLGVSTSTVRRDLNEMQQRGLVSRVHGGASVTEVDAEPMRSVREITYPIEKERIGRAAAAHVDDFSTVLILGGTTTEAMVPFLSEKRGITVVTNNLGIVERLLQHGDIDIVVLGGVLRRQEMSLLGHLTIAGIQELGIQKVFSGAFGIDTDIGVTGTNLSETQTDRSLATSAPQLYLLADHSKLHQRGPARLVPVKTVTKLLTDEGADPEILRAFTEAGVDVEVC